jgi:mRNA-degrading endonuclease RelE of RelBE toxin-antitoxin system
MVYRLIRTQAFDRAFARLSPDIRERFSRQLDKVVLDPYSLGKPLGRSWCRELKQEGFRLYYTIYDEEVVVLLVDVSSKKDQQVRIERIREELDVLYDFVRKNKFKS